MPAEIIVLWYAREHQIKEISFQPLTVDSIGMTAK